MTLEDILTLGKMGYSKADISALAGNDPAGNDPAGNAPEGNAPEGNDPAGADPDYSAQFAELKNSVDALTKAMQTINIKNASMGGGNDAPSVDDVIKKMIGGK